MDTSYSTKSTVFIAIASSILFVLAILVIYSFTLPRQGTTILPAGENYLGPNR